MKKYLLLLAFSIFASACDKEPETLMSPCVGAFGSPCDKRPVNQELLMQIEASQRV